MVNVLLTGAGAPGTAGTIYALKRSNDVRVVGCDVFYYKTGQYLVDKFCQVPPVGDLYLQVIHDIIEKEKIHVIIPQTTKEVEYLADKDFPVMCSPHKYVVNANDKWLLMAEAERVGVPIPKSKFCKNNRWVENAAHSFGYPDKKVVVKPRVSNGSRGLRILDENRITEDEYYNQKPDGTRMRLSDFTKICKYPKVIVSEYLEGDEYTVDCFRGKSGFVAIPRRRVEIRSGISFDNHVLLDRTLMDFSWSLAERLDLKYCFGFQFKEDHEGVPRLLECNPRVQGTMVASCFAGFNVIGNALKEFLGEKVDTSVSLKEVDFKRYWGGITIYNDKIVDKI